MYYVKLPMSDIQYKVCIERMCMRNGVVLKRYPARGRSLSFFFFFDMQGSIAADARALPQILRLPGLGSFPSSSAPMSVFLSSAENLSSQNLQAWTSS
jgi:hypothetical protein